MSFEDFFNHPFVNLEYMATEESYSKGVNQIKYLQTFVCFTFFFKKNYKL